MKNTKNLSIKFTPPIIIHLGQISFLSWVEKGRDKGAQCKLRTVYNI